MTINGETRKMPGKRISRSKRQKKSKGEKSKVPTKQLVGEVVSDKMDKTVVVAVTRRVKHPKYSKFIVRTARYKAHDEWNRCKNGDKVLIFETRPLSRTKCWMVEKILNLGSASKRYTANKQNESEIGTNSFMLYRDVKAFLPKKVLIDKPFLLHIDIHASHHKNQGNLKKSGFDAVKIGAHIHASISDFDFLSDEIQFTEVSSGASQLVFSLIPKRIGAKTIKVELFQDSKYLGGTKLRTEVQSIDNV